MKIQSTMGGLKMQKSLDYGKRQIVIEIPAEQLIAELHANAFELSSNPAALIEEALANPIGSAKLSSIINIKKPKNAVIVVNDITRPTPYQYLLPPLLKELETAGIPASEITLLIALGIHRPHTIDDNLLIFGEKICRKYRIENHDCDHNLVTLGTLANGMNLEINRTAAEADLLIATGLVGLHYFAGYSGGRKSILPGIAARSLIEANHKMMNNPLAHLGNYENNPVSDIMVEAAQKVGVDFILNVVTASHQDIVYCTAGDVYEAWLDAVKFCEKLNVVECETKADIVIASCGGYPKDINMYQAQKAMDAAALAVKPGGTIILLAECSEGLGEDVFEKWIHEAKSRQDIVDRFHSHFELGGHKAFAICRTLDLADIYLLSDLPDQTVKDLFLQPVHSIEEAMERAIRKSGKEASIILMPEAPKIAVKIRQ